MPFPLSLPDVPNHVLLAAPLIVLLGYTIFGATGFGSSIISVPALAHFFPLAFTVPLITTTDAFAATSTAFRLRRLVAWREVARLLPAMLIGIALGATLLLKLPRNPALLALGIFAAAYGTYVFVGPPRFAHAPGWLVWPVGLIGGVFSSLFGTGGPIYIVFLSARIDDKSTLRATSAIVVVAAVWIRLVLFIATGLLLDAKLLAMAAMLLPVMALGLWLGNHLHHALSRGGVLRLIAGLLMINGVALIVRAVESMHG
ncbi:MAG TPA: sulfite exporter TauE/SafE family protein [Casimicrobiaceae bacterium]|nr:sulfite exporter TauE/SafE family protein [Casimicrobiaceae bacterium]